MYKDDSEAATIENATGQHVTETDGSISNDETHDTSDANEKGKKKAPAQRKR
jgi:hypothetical protein